MSNDILDKVRPGTRLAVKGLKMRITQWGEYGIHCAAYLARRALEGAATVGAAEIAEAQGIDVQYAQQILQRLRRGNVIESVRGPHGGYRLTRPPAAITLGEVLTAAEGATFELICESKPIDPTRCSQSSACNLRALWEELRDHVNVFLNNKSLSDLIQRQSLEERPVQISRQSAQARS